MKPKLGRSAAALGAVVAFCVSMPVFAQDGVAGPASASSPDAQGGCVLHVWPGRGIQSVYYGWFHGGTINGAQSGRKGYPVVPQDPLSTAVQREHLGKLDIPPILGLVNYRTEIHPDALTAVAIRSSATRQIANSGPCYAELMIENIVFQNNAISGKWLNIVYRYRQFEGSSAEPVRNYGTFVTVRTNLFPPKEDADPAPALDELKEAFGKSVSEFGKEYAAYLKRNGARKGASITL